MPDVGTAPSVAAAGLARAWGERRAVAPPSERDGGLTLDDGYAIQDELVRQLAEGDWRPSGYKAGATSAAALSALGLDGPIFGRVFAQRAIGRDALRRDDLIAPRAEPEIALVLDGEVARADRDAVTAALASVHVAIEVADTRIADWGGGAADLAADCAATGAYALGPPVAPRACGELGTLAVELLVDGEARGAGRGGDLVGGDPIAVAVALADWCARRGARLGPGDVVLTGALAAPVELARGMRVRARGGDLGEVEIGVE